MELSCLLLLLPFLFGFLYLSKVRANGVDVRRLPPLPRGLPIIGNLHQVGALPHRTLRALAASNGAPDLMRLRLGQVEALVASSPAAAAALMREHDDVFATRPYFRTADILTYGFRDLVFAPHGVHWRHVRRLCSAHVLSGARSHAHNAAREQEVAALARHQGPRRGGGGRERGAVRLRERGYLPRGVRPRVFGRRRRAEE
jgi:hypothetical protein